MGDCMYTADRAGKAPSDQIDKQLEEDTKMFKCECKILASCSLELESYRPIVYKNDVLDSAQAIVLAMRKIGARYPNQALADMIVDYRLDATTGFTLSPEIADAIRQLWQDPIIPKVMDEHSSSFYLMDSAS